MGSTQQGLTLVELMIVVAVMAVIAAVAYPLYTGQTQKARRADAKIALESIAMAQERFYTVNGGYAANLSSLQVSADVAGGDSDQGYYALTLTQNTDQDFAATATVKSSGAQAGDAAKCGTFTVNHQGVKGSTGSLANCW
jgi:type IV pilus assembly protein PilE